MIDKALRIPKEKILGPIASRFMADVHPTTLTLLSFAAGVAASLAVVHQAYGLGVGLWAVNRVLDGLDGTVARMHGKQSEFGGYLDILLDTAIYALIPAALVMGAPSRAGWLSLICLLISFYVNAASWMYLAAVLEKRNLGAKSSGELTTVTMPVGLVEGTETVVFFTAFLLFPAAATTLFGLMAALVVVTICQRLVWARRHL